jgi:hypothetical protein
MTIKAATRLALWCVGLTLLANLLFQALEFVPVRNLPFYRDGDPMATMAGMRRLANIREASVALMNAGVLAFLIVLRSTQKEAA